MNIFTKDKVQPFTVLMMFLSYFLCRLADISFLRSVSSDLTNIDSFSQIWVVWPCFFQAQRRNYILESLIYTDQSFSAFGTLYGD